MGELVLTHMDSNPVVVERTSADSLRSLVQDHHGFIWRSLRRLGVPASQVDDAAQEVFLVALRRQADILLGRERAFLFAVAQRVASDVRRAGARSRERADEMAISRALEPSPQPDEALEALRARAQLDAVLDEMGDESRAAFVLFEIEGLTAPEIASLLEIPVGTVASRLRRGREEFHAAAKRIRARLLPGGVRT
jgi:RNA polymerase sigma-70 factor (ECF subfamily)